jgi:hypothetical protein
MDKSKLEEYRRAIDELQKAVEPLRDGKGDRIAAHDRYEKAKDRCDKARSALSDPSQERCS